MSECDQPAPDPVVGEPPVLKPTGAAESALVALRQIMRATETSARHIAKQSGLSPSQLIVLELIDHYGQAVPSQIASDTSLSHATVTALLDKLQERGLIQRARDHVDKRRVLLALTALGKTTLDAAPDSLQGRFLSRFAKLRDWEQAMLLASLLRIAAMLDAEDLDVAPMLAIGAIDRTPDAF